MKKLIMVMMTLTVMAGFTGCMNKDNGKNDSESHPVQDGINSVIDGVQDGIDDVISGVEDGVDDVKDNIESRSDSYGITETAPDKK